MTANEPLAGKVVVITGAAAGVGRAIALRFARERAKLGLVSRDRGALESLADELRGRGAQDVAIAPIDVSDANEVFAAAERWTQNLQAGPPLPAPPSFTGLALAGLAALRAPAGQSRWLSASRAGAIPATTSCPNGKASRGTTRLGKSSTPGWRRSRVPLSCRQTNGKPLRRFATASCRNPKVARTRRLRPMSTGSFWRARRKAIASPICLNRQKRGSAR